MRTTTAHQPTNCNCNRMPVSVGRLMYNHECPWLSSGMWGEVTDEFILDQKLWFRAR
eukprot:COSAG06_NODE_1487_length_9296_cov_19.025226_6_plen_57_part_00